MFTEAEIEALYSRVMERMVEAGWMESFTLTKGKGFQPVWTSSGVLQAAALKQLVSGIGLNRDDRLPMAFDIVCSGGTLVRERFPFQLPPPPELLKGLWNECVCQLGLRGDEDGLFGLVHIVLSWVPDDLERMKFLPGE